MAWRFRQHGFRVLVLEGGEDCSYPKLTVFPVATVEPVRWAAIVHESARRVHWLSENFRSPEAAQAAALREARSILASAWHPHIDRCIDELAGRHGA